MFKKRVMCPTPNFLWRMETTKFGTVHFSWTRQQTRGEPPGNTNSGSAVGMQDIKRGNARWKELMAGTVARRNNRLLHKGENTQSKGHTGDSSTNPVFTANACSGLLEVVAVRLSTGANNVDTLAVNETGSTISFIDAEIKTRLGTEGITLTVSVAGINGRKYVASERLSVKVIANEHDDDIGFHVHPRMYLGNRSYDYSQLKEISWFESTFKQSSWFERRESCHWSGYFAFIVCNGLRGREEDWAFGSQDEARLDSQLTCSWTRNCPTCYGICSQWQWSTVRTNKIMMEHGILRLQLQRQWPVSMTKELLIFWRKLRSWLATHTKSVFCGQKIEIPNN